MADYCIVVDFGSQYTQLIARRIRECKTYCIVQSYTLTSALQDNADDFLIGIILSGGPDTVFSDGAPKIPRWVIEENQKKNIPILGICYGMQALAIEFGGEVASAKINEFGYTQIRAQGHSQLLKGIQDATTSEGHGLLDVWMSHGDQVTRLPQNYKKIASSSNCKLAGLANEEAKIYALQFHPEVTHTKQGKNILSRFINQICESSNSWEMQNIVHTIIQDIQQQVKQDKVILGLSGGVDSSVTALLLQKAIGSQLKCVLINNGLLRLNEAEQVEETFKSNLGISLHTIDASERFIQALKGIEDPESKRKIIGRVFVEVFEEFASSQAQARWLAQGTIYSDVIESAGENSGKVIKSHHNVGGLPKDINLNILEPIRKLFKDEVRTLGKYIGIEDSLMNRHPFPGPGLGVRVLGEVTEDKVSILRQADAIFIDELHQSNYYHRLSQAFCIFLPIKSVGVVGDYRRYQWIIALRAVQTIDFMTAHWAHLPYELLDKISLRIVNEIKEVSRVVYDISGKPPATIEWE